jgi:hypothetical protein
MEVLSSTVQKGVNIPSYETLITGHWIPISKSTRNQNFNVKIPHVKCKMYCFYNHHIKTHINTTDELLLTAEQKK